MGGPKFSKGNHAPDRHGVFNAAVIILIFGLEVRTIWVRLTRAGERVGDHLSCRADQTPVQTGNRELVARFCDHMLCLTVKLGVRRLQKCISNCIGLSIWSMINKLLNWYTSSEFCHAAKM